MPEHAGYLDAWHKVLKQDKKAIFTAASRAVEFLHGLQPKSEDLTPGSAG